ncbi:MAG: peptidoglycan-binding protein [Clostridia bacterium]|nr:peptidoglycan-binding protein [Clostridia bacterium]
MNNLKRIVSIVLITLLALAPVATLAAPYRTLYYGDNGSDVKVIQKKLKSLGFFNGTIGGNYLDKTTAAVRRFEEYYGYTKTNYCTVKMQRHIINAVKPSDVYRTIHYGDYGEDVKNIQRRLKAMGYFNGTIGGNYLKQTRAAVKAFQRDFNYKVTNYCTMHMQKVILGKA